MEETLHNKELKQLIKIYKISGRLWSVNQSGYFWSGPQPPKWINGETAPEATASTRGTVVLHNWRRQKPGYKEHSIWEGGWNKGTVSGPPSLEGMLLILPPSARWPHPKPTTLMKLTPLVNGCRNPPFAFRGVFQSWPNTLIKRKHYWGRGPLLFLWIALQCTDLFYNF